MLIPTIIRMLSTGKSSINPWDFVLSFGFSHLHLPVLLLDLPILWNDFIMNHRFHWQSFAIGLLIFWMSKRTNRRERKASFG